MGFQQGLSGLSGAAKNLDVIGNNIANSTTVGFKSGVTQFADVYATSLTGTGGLQVGIGSQVAAVAQQFTQGSTSITNNPLDVAINGEGFFRLNGGGAITFSRNGQFHLDKPDANGLSYIVNNSGLRLTGYGVDSAGSIITANPTDLQISFADISPNTSSKLTLGMNLDSREAAIPVATTFDPTLASTYNHATSVTVYDERGNAHALTLYFRKVNSTDWDVYATLHNAAGNHVNLDGTPLPPAAAMSTLAFNADGTFDAANSTITPINIDGVDAGGSDALGTGASDIDILLPDFSQATLFGSSFGVNTVSQNGFASGRIVGLNVAEDGTVQGRYTNGQAKVLGQVALAYFANPRGLQNLGNNQWAETSDSGQPTVGAPGSGTLGIVQSGAVEDSNVDLTSELVNLIIAQRMYQANAQTVRAQDQILQTLINLR